MRPDRMTSLRRMNASMARSVDGPAGCGEPDRSWRPRPSTLQKGLADGACSSLRRLGRSAQNLSVKAIATRPCRRSPPPDPDTRSIRASANQRITHISSRSRTLLQLDDPCPRLSRWEVVG